MKKSVIRTGNRVALYARFSSDNQRSESIDAQIRAMTAYCQQKQLMIVKVYEDKSRSATTDQRPNFQEMIRDSKSNLFDIVLVHKLDRFARNRYDSAVYKRELKRNGVIVCSVLENLDDSPESIMMESVLEGMAEYYSQNLGREVMKGMKENALQCKHTGGVPPLGYDVDPETGKLVINEAEAKAVRLIFDMYADGHGYTSIIYELNRRGFKTKRKKDFVKNSLHDLLVNSKYAGTYTYNMKMAKDSSGKRNNHADKNEEEIIRVEGGCPRIVDMVTFDRVQQRLGERRRGKRSVAKYTYLFSGKVFCSECGRRMCGNTRQSGHGDHVCGIYSTYRCSLPKINCGSREINRKYLDDYVVKLLEERIFNPASMRSLMKKLESAHPQDQVQRKQRIHQLRDNLSETDLALERITDAVANGLLSETLIKRLGELERRKTEIFAELTLIEAESVTTFATEDLTDIPLQYKVLKQTPEDRSYRTLLCRFVERIVVRRYSVDITLKTGLGVYDSLDTTLTVRRQEIYEQGKKDESNQKRSEIHLMKQSRNTEHNKGEETV